MDRSRTQQLLSKQQQPAPTGCHETKQSTKKTAAECPPLPGATKPGPDLVGMWWNNANDSDKDTVRSFLKSYYLQKAATSCPRRVEKESPLYYAQKQPPLRLISATSRAKRDTFTTWHHLPKYGGGPAENTTSMFAQPQKVAPRHFEIHPSWK